MEVVEASGRWIPTGGRRHSLDSASPAPEWLVLGAGALDCRHRAPGRAAVARRIHAVSSMQPRGGRSPTKRAADLSTRHRQLRGDLGGAARRSVARRRPDRAHGVRPLAVLATAEAAARVVMAAAGLRPRPTPDRLSGPGRCARRWSRCMARRAGDRPGAPCPHSRSGPPSHRPRRSGAPHRR